MIEDFNFDSIQIKIPQRSENSHKGDFGKVLVLGGCKGMGGAAILSSEASLFCGSGLVHLHTHSTNVEASLKRNPEVMTLGIDNDYKIFDGIDVVLCGPGLKNDEWSYRVYKQAITINDKHVLILDAGALRYLSKSYKDFQVTNRSLILTPHPGEASMLLNVSIEEIQEDREQNQVPLQGRQTAGSEWCVVGIAAHLHQHLEQQRSGGLLRLSKRRP